MVLEIARGVEIRRTLVAIARRRGRGPVAVERLAGLIRQAAGAPAGAGAALLPARSAVRAGEEFVVLVGGLAALAEPDFVHDKGYACEEKGAANAAYDATDDFLRNLGEVAAAAVAGA